METLLQIGLSVYFAPFSLRCPFYLRQERGWGHRAKCTKRLALYLRAAERKPSRKPVCSRSHPYASGPGLCAFYSPSCRELVFLETSLPVYRVLGNGIP